MENQCLRVNERKSLGAQKPLLPKLLSHKNTGYLESAGSYTY